MSVPAADTSSTTAVNSVPQARSIYIQTGGAIAITILALVVRIMLTPTVGSQFPFATVYFAVTFAAWYGGWRPALISAFLGYLGVSYFIVSPYHSILLHSPADYIGASIFFFLSFSSAFFIESQRRAQTRAEASAQEARSRREALQESEARKAAIMQTALDAIISMDHKGNIIEFNPAAEKMFGYSQADVVGHELAQFIIPPDLRDRHRSGLARYLDTGEHVVLDQRIEIEAMRSGGKISTVEVAISRIPNQEPPQFVGYIRDITARKKNDTQQRFLTQVSDLLASSLDYQKTLESIARLVVPQLADWCVVDIAEENGGIRHVAIMHADPAKVELAKQLDKKYPVDPNALTGVPQVIRSGQAEMVADIPDELIRNGARDEEHYRILRELGIKSYICVPLIASGVCIGAITFIGAESGHRYGPDDLALAEELARRAATAVENARLFRAERERSQQLSSAISEVHHRVKNSLQSVGALLEMQMPDAGDSVPLEAVQDSLSQIKTIALVHDLLARDRPMGSVNIASVLTNLGQLLSFSMSAGRQRLRIEVDAEPVEMVTNTATSLALVVNELVTNAAKHQSSGKAADSNEAQESGVICVNLRRIEENIVVTVQDAGPGFPVEFNPSLHAHVGLELVQTLVSHDLHGSIHFGNGTAPADPGENRGGRVEITFPHSVCLEQ